MIREKKGAYTIIGYSWCTVVSRFINYRQISNMIRFLNLKNQICEGSNDFAFYDTVSNTICSFGEYGNQVFSTIEGFKCEFGTEPDNTTRPLRRFLALIHKDYFETKKLN